MPSDLTFTGTANNDFSIIINKGPYSTNFCRESLADLRDCGGLRAIDELFFMLVAELEYGPIEPGDPFGEKERKKRIELTKEEKILIYKKLQETNKNVLEEKLKVQMLAIDRIKDETHAQIDITPDNAHVNGTFSAYHLRTISHTIDLMSKLLIGRTE